MSRITPIIGQEAVVPGYGLGRVVSFERDLFGYIEIKPYISDITMRFDPKSIQLVKIHLEDEENK